MRDPEIPFIIKILGSIVICGLSHGSRALCNNIESLLLDMIRTSVMIQ